MAILRMKDIKNLSEKDREEKLKELKIELIKRKTKAEKKETIKEIKKAIARLLTILTIKKVMLKK